MTSKKSSLADRLIAARKAASLTLDEAAERANVSKTYLWELEQDQTGKKKPSADILLRLANAMDTTIGTLLGLPIARAKEEEIELSPSLVEFADRMKAMGTALTEKDKSDLASMRFRNAQPQTADEWHQLYLVLVKKR